jgi:hypothetical protein
MVTRREEVEMLEEHKIVGETAREQKKLEIVRAKLRLLWEWRQVAEI